MVADANRPESVIANGPVLGAYELFEYLDTTRSDMRPARAEDLLAANDMPVRERTLEDGREVLDWSPPKRVPRQSSATAKETAALVVQRQGTGKKQGTLKGKTVTIIHGRIPLKDFLRFLADFRELPIYSTTDPAVLQAREIVVVSDLLDVDFMVVEALLATNGVRVEEARVATGEMRLFITVDNSE